MENDIENTAEYFLLLESLKLQDEDESNKNRLESNINYLEKYIKDDISTIIEANAKMLGMEAFQFDDTVDIEQKYVVLMQKVLLAIKRNTNFNSEAKEDLISTRHMNVCIEAVQDVALFAMRYQLHECFYGNGVFDDALPNSKKRKSMQNLLLSLEFFDKMLAVRQFHLANSMEMVIRDYMAAIFSTILWLDTGTSKDTDGMLRKILQHKLDAIWLKISKLEYFRNLMLLKSMQKVPVALQKKLHQELIQKLACKNGFTTLVAVLQTASQASKRPPDVGNQQTYEIIANIVAFRGHTHRFQTVMIEQIFGFLELCLRNDAMMENMGAGLLALRRLYDLNETNRGKIAEFVGKPLKKLTQPEDILSGLIVMEHSEFCLIINLLYQLYYTSSVECLPSKMLIKYLPMLLELYYNVPDGFREKQQLADIVARCLNNRTLEELTEIVEKLYTRQFDNGWQTLHERLMILPNSLQTEEEICLKIGNVDYRSDFSISLSLPTLLIQAKHGILTYNVFMALLNLMSTKILDRIDESEIDISLFNSEDELVSILNAKYPIKIEIVLSLNTLITCQNLKSQIAENSREFVKFMLRLIEKRIDNQVPAECTESADQILLIMLTLTQELLEHTAAGHVPEEQRNFLPALVRLRAQSPNVLVQQHATTLICLLKGEMKSTNASIKDTVFNEARSLMESHESHLQVYGIQKLLNLLRQRDAVTMANGHVIIALALTTLKHKESYTFLNCVRLFIALVNVMEAQVLEILSDEYLNENANMDYRLVVGEAIIKVSQELGPLCYKYKDVLLNIFMHGARSTNDEFRMSSFSNLAQLCRTLCYQVLKFFQELLQLIDCELSTGKYLPSKRAAIFVLSELLEGIDNLMDFEQLLLPVYRMLKLIAATESCDDQLKIHATNGLKTLSEKCKKFLFPEETLRKEIQIFGIKNESTKANSKKHILEIN